MLRSFASLRMTEESSDGGGGNARAAGEGLRLDALLEGAHAERPVGIDGHEVGIGADGREKGIPARLAAFFLDIDGLHVRHETHEVARARVEEPAVQRRMERVHVDHPDADRLAVAVAREDLAGVRAVGRDEAEHASVGRLQAQRVGEGHDAAAAVAAHHAAGAVGIVVLHPEIIVRIVRQDHQAVGTDTPVGGHEAAPAVAQLRDALRRAERGDILRPPVEHHEIVARTRIFMQLHH